ncbi:flagellar basal-body MS-ring/collar protein FliF [Defluviimonas sp. WL0075]|uniref:Flagellar M-ring protein n=1 Tax=Albidovulum sediminicola TaxID=2984331 RepID=A0ABT2YWJ3_9RHOB|nr:flagellar basal-body MS-ring/collar protein FliF [Defluviimonas sp. WL0075]MCV2863137.1 flagellar basal-body MS-ring/collar protein FliF [Defluviimonas sp. WL0075]
MQQFLTLWQALRPTHRVIVAGAAALIFAAVLLLAGAARNPSLALLYAGLDQARAGEVLAALDRHGVPYEIQGESIYVDGARRDEMRMLLASEGLPANSGAGYELLDGLSGFGTTAQMFDAAYLRAKEGEIARTIAALPDVRFARVHIANVEPAGFRRAAPPTASVMVATTLGTVPPEHARALRFLVASAVAGLQPADVSILDGQGNLVPGDTDPGVSAASRAEDLRRSVQRLLEARVGAGNAVVEVAVDIVTERETISERRLDPESRIAISTDNEERSQAGSDSGAAPVTVASNLPSGNSDGGQGSSSQSNESRERVNFEVSETTRELLRTPGAVRRQTVAVLLNAAPAAEGQPPEPRSEEELAALRELVAAAVGFDEGRGDVISIRSLPFEPFLAGTEAPGAGWIRPTAIDVTQLVQAGVAALVALLLGLFVVRPILAGARAAGPVPPAAAVARLGAAPDPDALTGEIEDDDASAGVTARPASPSRTLGPPREASDDPPDPVARLRALMVEKRDETAEILRSWMEEGEQEEAR